jgi:alkylhydroperoxidase/carboxymuconolactone decarboxylase family protein YurZ
MTKPNDPVTGSQFHGLTKREYFAAMAMQVLTYTNGYDAAVQAVKYADELIKELNKTANEQ